jgi:hypothetical protein
MIVDPILVVEQNGVEIGRIQLGDEYTIDGIVKRIQDIAGSDPQFDAVGIRIDEQDDFVNLDETTLENALDVGRGLARVTPVRHAHPVETEAAEEDSASDSESESESDEDSQTEQDSEIEEDAENNLPLDLFKSVFLNDAEYNEFIRYINTKNKKGGTSLSMERIFEIESRTIELLTPEQVVQLLQQLGIRKPKRLVKKGLVRFAHILKSNSTFRGRRGRRGGRRGGPPFGPSFGFPFHHPREPPHHGFRPPFGPGHHGPPNGQFGPGHHGPPNGQFGPGHHGPPDGQFGPGHHRSPDDQWGASPFHHGHHHHGRGHHHGPPFRHCGFGGMFPYAERVRGQNRRASNNKNKARLVSHVSIPDKTNLKSGETFEKEWIIRNDSEKPWPKNCTLVQVCGDNLSTEGTTSKVPTSLSPGEEGHVIIGPLKVPDAKGLYKSQWRVQAPDGSKFGQRVWCEIFST